jgi:hypothetical protein
MAKSRGLSKACQAYLAEEAKARKLEEDIHAQTQELMSCGFTIQEAQAWLRKQHIRNIFEKDERAKR